MFLKIIIEAVCPLINFLKKLQPLNALYSMLMNFTKRNIKDSLFCNDRALGEMYGQKTEHAIPLYR